MDNSRTRQRNLLKSLQVLLNRENVPSTINHARQDNNTIDILTSLHQQFGQNSDEVIGEFYFTPMPQSDENEEILYFTTVITLSNQLKPDYLSELIRAISIINFYLPCGNFAVNADSSLLVFKMVTVVSAAYLDEVILDMMNLNVAHSLDLSERYINALFAVADGEATADQVAQLWLGGQ